MKKIMGFIERLFNRLITHNRDREGDFGIRVVIHIPIGFLMGLLLFNDRGIVSLFLKYERNEDLHTEDQAWKDIFGAMVGFVIGRIVAVGLFIWLVAWLIGRFLG